MSDRQLVAIEEMRVKIGFLSVFLVREITAGLVVERAAPRWIENIVNLVSVGLE